MAKERALTEFSEMHAKVGKAIALAEAVPEFSPEEAIRAFESIAKIMSECRASIAARFPEAAKQVERANDATRS